MEKHKTFKTFIFIIVALLIGCMVVGYAASPKNTGKQVKALAYTQTVDGMEQAVISSRLD